MVPLSLWFVLLRSERSIEKLADHHPGEPGTRGMDCATATAVRLLRPMMMTTICGLVTCSPLQRMSCASCRACFCTGASVNLTNALARNSW